MESGRPDREEVDNLHQRCVYFACEHQHMAKKELRLGTWRILCQAATRQRNDLSFIWINPFNADSLRALHEPPRGVWINPA